MSWIQFFIKRGIRYQREDFSCFSRGLQSLVKFERKFSVTVLLTILKGRSPKMRLHITCT